MKDLPGYGDSNTWGPINSAYDPRYDSSYEDYVEGELYRVLEETEYRCTEVRRVLASKGVRAGIDEWRKIFDAEIYV